MQEILTESLQTVPGLELAGVAETATEALAAFESHRPDVVILDLALPGGQRARRVARDQTARASVPGAGFHRL